MSSFDTQRITTRSHQLEWMNAIERGENLLGVLRHSEIRIEGNFIMKYIGDAEYWNNKFSNRAYQPLSPEKSLVKNIEFFKKGSVLDIACGDGRNALFLIENGFNVTGVDFSIEALTRLEIFAKRNNYCVSTKEIDLSIRSSLTNIGVFDNILINHYRLGSEQLKEIENHITENGILFICGFGYKHKIDSKIRMEDLIQKTDFRDINKSFELLNYIENQDDRGFIVTYIFRKKNN